MAERKKSTFQRLQHGRLNRKQRKELAQRLAKDDPGLEIVHRDAVHGGLLDSGTGRVGTGWV